MPSVSLPVSVSMSVGARARADECHLSLRDPQHGGAPLRVMRARLCFFTQTPRPEGAGGPQGGGGGGMGGGGGAGGGGGGGGRRDNRMPEVRMGCIVVWSLFYARTLVGA
jgi:hypothetical protein